MLQQTPALSIGSTPVVGQPITPASVTGVVRNTGGIQDLVQSMANNIYTTVTSSTYTVQPNQDVYLLVTFAGNVTITLPECSTQNKPIVIEKRNANNFTITVNRSGSNTIQNSFDPILAPTATSLVLNYIGDILTLIPNTNGIWGSKINISTKIIHTQDNTIYNVTNGNFGVGAGPNYFYNTQTSVYVGSGQRIMLQAQTSLISSLNSFASFTIYENTTGLVSNECHLITIGISSNIYIYTVLTPTAGLHTYRTGGTINTGATYTGFSGIRLTITRL